MMRFNIHKKGFMLAEVMISISLLAIFGSTLFVSQTALFTRVLRTRVENKAILYMDTLMLEYKMKMKQAELAGESIQVESISREYTNPDMTVTVSGSYAQIPYGQNADQVFQSIFKIEAKAEHEYGDVSSSLLLYKPKPQDKPKPQESES